MANNFTQSSFTPSGFQSVGPVAATLVAGASAAEIVTFDVTALHEVTVSFAVSAAPLTGLEIWVRGDPLAQWIPLGIAQIDGYGRSDSGSDVTTTPAGTTGFVQLKTFGWSHLQLRAKSAGAAALSITAGGK